MRKWTAKISFLVSVVILSGCAVPTDNQIRDKLKSWAPTCSAIPVVGAVNSDTDFLVNVTASKGAGPYSIADETDTFESTTAIAKRFTNTGTTDEVVTDTVLVRDSLGLTAACDYSISVRPQTTNPTPTPNPNALACTMDATPISPMRNENTVLKIKATGGTPSYSFPTIVLSAGTTIVGPFAMTSTSEATATVKFANAGTNSATAIVKDSTNSQATCAKSITVRGAAAVTLAASPSTTVSASSSITLTATATDFTSTPSFLFSSTNSGAIINSSGNVAVVTSKDGVARTFDVKVVAVHSNGELAQATKTLTFTGSTTPTPTPSPTPSPDTIACSVTTNPVPSYVGEAMTIKATVSAAYAAAGARIIDVTTSWDARAYVYALPTNLTANAVFENSGVFPVRVFLRDNFGRTTNCTTMHQVLDYWWW